MSYIDNNLIGNESVLYVGKVTKLALIPWIIWSVLFLLPTAGMSLGLIILGYVIIRSNEAGITTKRVIAKTGLIRRDTIEIGIDKISSLQIKQGIFGRVFGYGSLMISDVGASKAPIKYIKDPMTFRRRFFEIQEQNK